MANNQNEFAGKMKQFFTNRAVIVTMVTLVVATGIIIAHNHPSGVCLPSNEDLSLTRKIRDATNANDIRFIDHIIVTPSSWRSLISDRLI